jgi:predicted nucleic acid-binding Zn ribbon protein
MFFDFHCPKCDITIEDLKLTDAQKKQIDIHCKECHSLMVQVLHVVPFHLKGEGWPGKENGTQAK